MEGDLAGPMPGNVSLAIAVEIASTTPPGFIERYEASRA